MTRTRHMTKDKTHDKDKMMTMTVMTTDKNTDKASRGKAKSKGYKGKGMVKRVEPEGLLEPMQYWDVEGARHYACPYGCPEEVVDFLSIEEMWSHIRKVHGKGDGRV